MDLILVRTRNAHSSVPTLAHRSRCCWSVLTGIISSNDAATT